jgi:hypothetical protein
MSIFVSKPGVFGVQGVTGGARKGVTFPTSPPALPNLQHWFDFDDQSTVWADVLATVPITEGVAIRRIDNKGYEGLHIEDQISLNPEPAWFLDPISGRHVAKNTVQSRSVQQVWSSSPSGAAGILLWAIYRPEFQATNAGWALSWNNFGGASASYGVRANGTATPPDDHAATIGTQVPVIGPLIFPEWVWAYSGNDTTDTGRAKLAGQAEVVVAETYVPVPNPNSVTIAAVQGLTLEAGVYDKMLSAAQFAELDSYITGRLGAAPPF